MGKYQDMLDRATIQYLSKQIQDSPLNVFECDTFSEREKKYEKVLDDALKKHLSMEQLEIVQNTIWDYSSDLSKINFNLGVKVGAKLMNQLLDNKEIDY